MLTDRNYEGLHWCCSRLHDFLNNQVRLSRYSPTFEIHERALWRTVGDVREDGPVQTYPGTHKTSRPGFLEALEIECEGSGNSCI